MNYNGTIYRPPVEANTFLLPVTEGCTHNACTFCNMYATVPFRMLTVEEMTNWLDEMLVSYGAHLTKVERIYLVGANPFALSAEKLLERIDVIRQYLPNVKVITMYAAVRNIMMKSDDDLRNLKDAGVDDLYVGIESVLEDVLESINKGNTVEEARTQLERLNRIGINHRDLYMLGTAGKGRGIESGTAMGKFINETKPTMILINTMSAFPGTKLEEHIREGKFVEPGETEILQEEKALLETITLPDMYFWAAHAMDSVRLAGYIDDKKEDMLATLSTAIEHMDDELFKQQFHRRGL